MTDDEKIQEYNITYHGGPIDINFTQYCKKIYKICNCSKIFTSFNNYTEIIMNEDLIESINNNDLFNIKSVDELMEHVYDSPFPSKLKFKSFKNITRKYLFY